MSKDRAYSTDVDTITLGVGARLLSKLLNIMPCGHQERYKLGNTCLVCENTALQKQVNTLIDRTLGNYDLD